MISNHRRVYGIYIYIFFFQESIKNDCKASVKKMKFFVTSEVHDFNIKLFRNIACNS